MSLPTASLLAEAFRKNFSLGREVGAAVSVWRGDGEVAHFFSGTTDSAGREPWTRDTLVLVWSATKGLASACVLQAMESAGVGPCLRVAEIWPEFSRAGKSAITLGQVLSHTAGLAALDKADVSVLDHEAVVEALEHQVPCQQALGSPGYGPRTFGFLADEIVRRLSGGTHLSSYWREQFGEPLGLDLWIGLPPEHHHRVAPILQAKASPTAGNDPFFQAFAQTGSYTKKAFSSPSGLPSASSMNTPSARAASIPSFSGIGSASSLAKFYAMLASGGCWDGRKFFGPEAIGWMQSPLSRGFDRVLLTEVAFSAGYMMDPLDSGGNKLRSLLGPSRRAFGHPGAGGSLGFADPENGIGFAYVMNQMEPGALPCERAARLVEAIYAGSGDFSGGAGA